MLALAARLKVEGFLQDLLTAEFEHFLTVHGRQYRNGLDVVFDLDLLDNLHHVLA